MIIVLIDEIKKANMEALKSKNKDARAALSVVINKFNIASIEQKAQGKELGDNDLIAIISKVLKELKEEKEGYQRVNNIERVNGIEVQEKVLQGYLPKMMSEEEIKEVILKLDDRSIPSVMKHFKENYLGKVDMGLVSKIARSL